MRFEPIRMQFYETYYYANIVHNILCDPFSYIRNMHSWHEDREPDLFLSPFRKNSVLHDFCWYVIDSLIHERMEEEARSWPVSKLWIDEAFKFHGIETAGFRAWRLESGRYEESTIEDDLYEYHGDLWNTGEMESLLEQLTSEVFQVLFSNRELLSRLNQYIAGSIERISKDELPEEHESRLAKDGVPARVGIPEWVKRAVLHRDRGLCCSCSADVSGLVSTTSDKHYDHIIPLSKGGINDVTNIQLLCEQCNLAKGNRSSGSSNKYQPWYR